MPELQDAVQSDVQIAADFLRYWQAELSADVAYAVAPTRLQGGADARLYRYQLVGEEPKVLRVLRPAHQVQELAYHQFVHQTLNQQGLKAPLIEHVCGDPSVLGGVFAVMELVPGQPLGVQPAEIQASVLGESMARMHGLDVRPFVDTFRRAGIADEHFLFPAMLQGIFEGIEQTMPWAAELIGWLRDQLPLADLDRAVIHGDYHANNVMVEHGTVTGVLDWGFAIADPAVDLAHLTNDYLVFARQLDPAVSLPVRQQFVDGVFKAYEAIRPVHQERIQAFRVLHLFGALTGAATGPEFMRRPESRRDYLAFLEQTTGLTLSPPA